MMESKVYVVVTQTGTILSRLLKVITHADYNHVSLSVDPTLNVLYSFGRKHPYNALIGGFVKESPKFGTFKRFSETEAIVLALEIPEEKRQEIEADLVEMYEHRKEYRYDTIGLLLAWAKILYVRENTYYCSSFVKAFLVEHGLTDEAPFGRFPKPIEFLDIDGAEEIYRGKLRCYEEWAEHQKCG